MPLFPSYDILGYMVATGLECGEGWKSVFLNICEALRMGLPIVENLSGFCGNIFRCFRSPPIHFNEQVEKRVRIPPVWSFVLGS